MIHLDLFSGIGGFSLAAQWVWKEEHHVHCFVENDPFCQKVLKKHWPNTLIHNDIKDYKHDGTAITLLTGGFPCQVFSVAGKRKGKEDDRYLWPEMFKIITEVKPTWVIGENVPGIINMELNQVLSDLENQGYETQTLIIPACAVDASHRRDRVWIVAYAKHSRGDRQRRQKIQQRKLSYNEFEVSSKRIGEDMADTIGERQQNHKGGSKAKRSNRSRTLSGCNGSSRKHAKWLPEPGVGRVANGIPRKVDRLRSLGNAIVPQCVMPIMQAIKEIEDNLTP